MAKDRLAQILHNIGPTAEMVLAGMLLASLDALLNLLNGSSLITWNLLWTTVAGAIIDYGTSYLRAHRSNLIEAALEEYIKPITLPTGVDNDPKNT